MKPIMKHGLCPAILCTAVLLFASCGDAGDTAAVTTEAPLSGDTVAVTETETETRIKADLPDADFEGYAFRIITRGEFNQHWSSKDISAVEANGDLINDAVYKRNTAVCEKYNFAIVEIGDIEDIATAVKKTVQAGEDAYDMVCAGLNGPISTLAPAGMLVDLYTVPNLDLTKPWYDQNAISSLSIGGTLHAVTGELTIMDNDATWVVLFNKQLAENFDFGNLYEKVENGSWTIDAMSSMAKEVANDINGDGVMDETDQWGVIGESFNTFAYIVGSGCQYVAKDDDDIPYFTLDSEKLFNAFEKAAALNGDFNVCAYATNFSSKYTGDIFVACIDPMFSSGKVLFNTCGMNRVTLFRSMETDFGILPQPKYDEAQTEYYNPVSMWCCNSIAVPASATDLSRTGHVIEALSAESLYTLTPAYYDQTLKTKASRDEESAAMLDIIFASRVYDLSNMYDFGSIFSTINALCEKSDPAFTSTVEKKIASAQKALDKIVTFYTEEQ